MKVIYAVDKRDDLLKELFSPRTSERRKEEISREVKRLDAEKQAAADKRDQESGRLKSGIITLLTPDEFEKLPDGTILTSISGMKLVKGVDRCDDEDRSGLLGFGLLPENMPKGFVSGHGTIWDLSK